MQCNRCGKCCKHAYFDLHIIDGDPQGLLPWLTYHGCEVLKSGKKFMLKTLIPCVNWEIKDGIGNCRIYENRPQMCKDHWCKEAECIKPT